MDLKSLLSPFFFSSPHHDSEIGVTEAIWCPRKAWFRHMYGFSGKNYRMIMGKLAHEALEAYLRSKVNAETEVRCEYPLSRNYKLVGHTDAIINGEVYEFKFSQNPIPNHEVIGVYFGQVNAYLNMLDIEVGHLVIFTFDSRLRWYNEYEVERDENGFNSVVSRAEKIIDYISSGKLPPKTSLEWECNECPFKPICSALRTEATLDIKRSPP